MPVCYLSRTEHFSSAHRLNSPHLSAQENKDLYGKCNHQNYHGHNYVLHLTLKGEINHQTGMLINITLLKQSLSPLLLTLDHKNLDLDIDFFKQTPSTVENLCVYIWTKVKEIDIISDLLYKVVVEETVNNRCTYKGE